MDTIANSGENYNQDDEMEKLALDAYEENMNAEQAKEITKDFSNKVKLELACNGDLATDEFGRQLRREIIIPKSICVDGWTPKKVIEELLRRINEKKN